MSEEEQAGSLDEPKYTSGYTDEQKHELEVAYAALERRVSRGEGEVTRKEFKEIVIPWMRCRRVDDFILKEPKPKAVKPPKEPKPKKLTKKRIKELTPLVLEKLLKGEDLSPEEQEVSITIGGIL